ncbi:MAG: hypothetical protein WB755_14175, partial [Terriglobales bacterium]
MKKILQLFRARFRLPDAAPQRLQAGIGLMQVESFVQVAQGGLELLTGVRLFSLAPELADLYLDLLLFNA